jgi:extradiol dioxygenase family protein
MAVQRMEPAGTGAVLDNAKVTFKGEKDEDRTAYITMGSGAGLQYVWWQSAGVDVPADHITV